MWLPADQKRAILTAREQGFVSDEEANLLLQVYSLEGV